MNRDSWHPYTRAIFALLEEVAHQDGSRARVPYIRDNVQHIEFASQDVPSFQFAAKMIISMSGVIHDIVCCDRLRPAVLVALPQYLMLRSNTNMLLKFGTNNAVCHGCFTPTRLAYGLCWRCDHVQCQLCASDNRIMYVVWLWRLARVALFEELKGIIVSFLYASSLLPKKAGCCV